MPQVKIVQQAIEELYNESSEGFEMCCQAMTLRQLAAGQDHYTHRTHRTRCIPHSLHHSLTDRTHSPTALTGFTAGTHRPITDSVRIRKYIVENWDRTPNLTIRIDPEVPDWIMLPKLLFAIIMRNALHNAGVSDAMRQAPDAVVCRFMVRKMALSSGGCFYLNVAHV